MRTTWHPDTRVRTFGPRRVEQRVCLTYTCVCTSFTGGCIAIPKLQRQPLSIAGSVLRVTTSTAWSKNGGCPHHRG